MKITLEELRAWVAVVDSSSITAAASQLAQTSSGISRALSRLESQLQTTLLHRTTRQLALAGQGDCTPVRFCQPGRLRRWLAGAGPSR